MIKRNLDTPFPVIGANFSSKAAQENLNLVPGLVVLDELNFDKSCVWTVQLPTDFIIHSFVNKL